MAKVKASQTADENTVAAHQFITKNAEEFARHADVLKRRVEVLSEENVSLSEELTNAQAAAEKAAELAERRYERDTAEFKNKIIGLEEKLRRVVGAINS